MHLTYELSVETVVPAKRKRIIIDDDQEENREEQNVAVQAPEVMQTNITSTTLCTH